MEKKTKQQLEPLNPLSEATELYPDLELVIASEGGPIDKIMVYTSRYPSILISWAFLTLVVLAICDVKDVFVCRGVLVLGGVGYIGSMIKRWNNDKQKRYRAP